MESINNSIIKEIMENEDWCGSDDEEKKVNNEKYKARKEEEDEFIQNVLDSLVYKEKKVENKKEENDEVVCLIEKLLQETLIGIFTYLPIYTIFKLQFVCMLFNHIINKFYLNIDLIIFTRETGKNI